MDSKKRIDTLLDTMRVSVQDELASLLGVEFVLADARKKPVTKAEAFNTLAGSQICTRIDLVGEMEGSGALLVGVKDAILLAGTLIMLPSSELDEIVRRDEYNEEVENSYTEITNIICGSFVRDIGGTYSKSCSFVKHEQGKIMPPQVDIESDEPVKNELFYQAAFSMALSGAPLGEMVVLLPAVPFDIQLGDVSSADSEDTEAAPEPARDQAAAADDEQKPDVEPAAASGPDFEKHKEKFDDILGNCPQEMSDEVSQLLGADVRLLGHTSKIISKKDFFSDEVSDRQVVASITTTGEIEDNCFVSLSEKDAIWFGGNLLMMPEPELQTAVDEENFSPDMEDAYGEIVSLFSGVLTAAFEGEHTEINAFVKAGLQQVLPADVKPSGDEPISDQDYYLSSMNLLLGDKKLGSIHLLFPCRILQIDELEKIREDGAGNSGWQSTATGAQEAPRENVHQAGVDSGDEGGGEVDILLIGDDENEVAKLKKVLENRGYAVRVLSFKDNVNDSISRGLKAVYLVAQSVDEQAFGVAIKVSSVCSLPLIVAAPGWTKTKVLKAVKYGVRDILLTPATTEEIEESIANNLAMLAA